jgi:hypothetical protein
MAAWMCTCDVKESNGRELSYPSGDYLECRRCFKPILGSRLACQICNGTGFLDSETGHSVDVNEQYKLNGFCPQAVECYGCSTDY